MIEKINANGLVLILFIDSLVKQEKKENNPSMDVNSVVEKASIDDHVQAG